MAHLDENSKASPKIRTSVAEVLSKIIAIAAGESIGPSVLEIINSLLTHLRHSVMTEIPPEHRRDEKMYQEALINALGEFANHLPDYQKIEIMKFIMSKVPQFTDNSKKTGSNVAHALLQNILLKSLLKVCCLLFLLKIKILHLLISTGWHQIPHSSVLHYIPYVIPGASAENVDGS